MTKQSNKEKKELTCPKCNTQKVKKDGKRKTDNRGLIQRFKCKECSYRFVKDEGFFRMRNHPKKITCALDLFYRGVSTRKVQEHFKAFYPHNSSHKSIYRWIIKYSNMISKFTDNLKLKVGSELQIDEQAHARMGERNWLIDSIDTKTRFVVASNFHKSRGQKEIRGVLKMVKQKTLSQFKVITSDGYTAYPRVVKQVFGYYNFQRKEMYHNVVMASRGDGFNVPIERFHNNVRDRTKIMRGFHGSVESADAILKGFVVYYNFVTKHQGLECRPYEMATDLKFNSENKWLELIGMAKE